MYLKKMQKGKHPLNVGVIINKGITSKICKPNSTLNNEEAFVPNFDADGNQTLVRTATGIWSVSYNAENRPVIFQKITDSMTTRITCSYDSMGRRATKKVEEITTDAEGNESITVITNHRFIYRGYLHRQRVATSLAPPIPAYGSSPGTRHSLWLPDPLPSKKAAENPTTLKLLHPSMNLLQLKNTVVQSN